MSKDRYELIKDEYTDLPPAQNSAYHATWILHAVRDFRVPGVDGVVRAGELGGRVWGPEAVPQQGDAWVAFGGKAVQGATLRGASYVDSTSTVWGGELVDSKLWRHSGVVRSTLRNAVVSGSMVEDSTLKLATVVESAVRRSDVYQVTLTGASFAEACVHSIVDYVMVAPTVWGALTVHRSHGAFATDGFRVRVGCQGFSLAGWDRMAEQHLNFDCFVCEGDYICEDCREPDYRMTRLMSAHVREMVTAWVASAEQIGHTCPSWVAKS